MPYEVLIIDDDVYIGNMLEEVLKKENYAVLRAYSGTEALRLLSNKRPDLVLLDLMLPGLPGEEVLLKTKGIPVIVVSAKVGIDDKIKLLLEGAADYITKPFDMKELLARITVQLRNKVASCNGMHLIYEDISLDLVTHEILAEEIPVKLTKTEFSILKLLMQNPKQVISKSRMLDSVSLDTPDCMESSLKVHASNLRNKLRSVTGKDYIERIRGEGVVEELDRITARRGCPQKIRVDNGPEFISNALDAWGPATMELSLIFQGRESPQITPISNHLMEVSEMSV